MAWISLDMLERVVVLAPDGAVVDGREAAGDEGLLVCAKAGIAMSAATATLARSLVLFIRYLLLVGSASVNGSLGERFPPSSRPSVAHS
jgi:hypothetical protein